MAAYETTLSASYAPAYAQGQARQLITQTAIVALTTAMINNADDDVGLFWVPKGAVPVSCCLRVTDVDTDASPAIVWDVGDSGDEDRLLAAVTTGQAAGRTDEIADAGFLYKYTARTQIRAYVKTAAATGATGTLKFSLTYFIDDNFDTTALTAA